MTKEKSVKDWLRIYYSLKSPESIPDPIERERVLSEQSRTKREKYRNIMVKEKKLNSGMV